MEYTFIGVSSNLIQYLEACILSETREYLKILYKFESFQGTENNYVSDQTCVKALPQSSHL